MRFCLIRTQQVDFRPTDGNEQYDWFNADLTGEPDWANLTNAYFTNADADGLKYNNNRGSRWTLDPGTDYPAHVRVLDLNDVIQEELSPRPRKNFRPWFG